MKKFLVLVLLGLFGFGLVGCEENAVQKQLAEQFLSQVLISEGVDLQQVTENIDLKVLQVEGLSVKWESSDPTAISNEGVITRGKEDKKVTVTVYVDYNGYKLTQAFDLTILREGAEPQYTVESITVILEKIKFAFNEEFKAALALAEKAYATLSDEDKAKIDATWKKVLEMKEKYSAVEKSEVVSVAKLLEKAVSEQYYKVTGVASEVTQKDNMVSFVLTFEGKSISVANIVKAPCAKVKDGETVTIIGAKLAKDGETLKIAEGILLDICNK